MRFLCKRRAITSLWWFNAARLYPLKTIFLGVCACVQAAAGVLIFPLLGFVIEGFSTHSGPNVTRIILAVSVVTIPTFLLPITTLVARQLNYDLLALGKESIVSASLHTDGQARALALDSDLRQWWFRESTDLAVMIVGMRVAALVGFITVAHWNIFAAISVSAAFILNGNIFQRWMVADIAEHDLDDRASTSIFHAVTTNRNGEFLHFGAYGFLAQLYGQHMRSRIRKATRARGKQLVMLGLSTALVVVALSYVCLQLTADIAAGTRSVGLVVTVIPAFLALAGAGPTGDAGVAVHKAQKTLKNIVRMHNRDTQQMTVVGEEKDLETSGASDLAVMAKNLSVRIGEKTIVRDINVEFREGEFIGVVGHNGAGKTTLLRTLAGLIPPASGTLTVRHAAAMVLQDPPRFPLALAESSLHHEMNLSTILPRYGLDSDCDPRAGLSGGQWQRLALARAHAAVETGRRLLLLDEPFAALDVDAEQRVAATLDELRQRYPQLTIVLSTHRLGILAHADRVLVLSQGRISEMGSHDQLMAKAGDYAATFQQQKRSIHGT
ncbi:ABC transporter ATP-binding protein/permease [Corynebacterium felinum]